MHHGHLYPLWKVATNTPSRRHSLLEGMSMTHSYITPAPHTKEPTEPRQTRTIRLRREPPLFCGNAEWIDTIHVGRALDPGPAFASPVRGRASINMHNRARHQR